MADTGAMVIDEARRWIGTPWLHGASTRGAGADCLGLVLGVWRVLHGAPPRVETYAEGWTEADRAERLRQGLAAHLREIDPAKAGHGAIVLLRLREDAPARHVGLLTEDRPEGAGLVHAFSRRGVIESPFGAPWRARLAAAFLFPEIA